MSKHATRLIRWMSRIGYSARGIVYLLIGIFAVMSVYDHTLRPKGATSSLEYVNRFEGGHWLVLLLALGLLCYSGWRFVQAVMDLDNHGSRLKGFAIRSGIMISSLMHLALGLIAFKIVYQQSQTQSNVANEWFNQLMSAPFGMLLMLALGAGVCIAGFVFFYRAWSIDLRKLLSADKRRFKWLRPLCRFGLVARGVVFILSGWFIIGAAIVYDADIAKNLSETLQYIREQPFGSYLLLTIGLGLMAFALYSFLEAAYRRIPILVRSRKLRRLEHSTT